MNQNANKKYTIDTKNTDTIIFLDWDDTLFPTSWVMNSKINLNDEKIKNNDIFNKLDAHITGLIEAYKKYGKVIIVTNAMKNWIRESTSILPKTYKIISSINVISARELYQTKSNNVFDWKKNAFKKIIVSELGNKSKKIMNIISIGDADYEYKALVDLYGWNMQNIKILKAIKLINNPSYYTIIDQINVLKKAAHDICNTNKHLDWNFKSN